MEQSQRRLIHNVGAIIIGDEVLNGKTIDTNSPYLAKFCFSLGLNLNRIEVIPDEEEDIAETARRMSEKYDMVITSGGIGPTHDDITYNSIAKAFGLKLKLHQDTMDRMKEKSKSSKDESNFSWDTPSPTLSAKQRMALLPFDEENSENNEVLFVDDELWVPISVVNGNIYILPGVPRLFTQMLEGLRPILLSRLLDPEGKGLHRIMFSTPLGESAIATFLTELAEKVKERGVKVGSYPRMPRGRNTVTLVGKDKDYMEGLVEEVERGVQGKRIEVEGEDDSDTEKAE